MKKVSALVMALGMAIIFGTAGASDLDMVSGLQMTMRLLFGMALVAGGFLRGRLWE